MVEDSKSLFSSNASLPLEAAWTRANQGSGMQQAACSSLHKVIEDEESWSDRTVSLPLKAVGYHANEGSGKLHSVRLSDASSSDDVSLVQMVDSLGIVVSRLISSIRLTLGFLPNLLHSRTSFW